MPKKPKKPQKKKKTEHKVDPLRVLNEYYKDPNKKPRKKRRGLFNNNLEG